MPIPLATKLSIFEARNEYYSNWHLIHPGVGNTLGGCPSNRYPFAPALATRSGAALRIGIHSPRHWQHARGLRLAFIHPALATRSGAAPCIYSPDVSNTLGGYASFWYSYIHPMLATHSGAASYAVNLSSLLHHRRCSVCYTDFSSTYFGSSTTSPTASIRR
jgi:hypothetical protein